MITAIGTAAVAILTALTKLIQAIRDEPPCPGCHPGTAPPATTPEPQPHG